MKWQTSLKESATRAVLSKGLRKTKSLSGWGSLSDRLICTIGACDSDGKAVDGGVKFVAAVKDATFSQAIEWRSLFEDYEPSQRSRGLSAASIAGGVEALSQILNMADKLSNVQAKSHELASELADRSTITKINSKQVYMGHEPAKIELTCILRAWKDPVAEVEAQLENILTLAYPAEVAKSYLESASEASQGERSTIEALFPTNAPTSVYLEYKGKRYAPLVIENISFPLSGSTSEAGDVYKEITLSLGTKTAWDSRDIRNVKKSEIAPKSKVIK